MAKVLLLGESGQLASELGASKPVSIELKILSYAEFCTLVDTELKQLFTSFEPDWVINALAYNQVDQAELLPELAMMGNVYLVQRLQKLCAFSQSRLLHISTDYVFDCLVNTPDRELARAQPLNQYGKSKRAVELWLLQEYADFSVIIRTSWLYSFYVSNFAKTMLQLMQNKTQLKVVQDQIGSSCWAYGLASVIWQIILQKIIVNGLYYWADSGYCSRYDFAVKIQAVNSELFNSTATRHAFSALDSGLLRDKLSLP